MGITLNGIVHGRRIDLDGDARLPDGTPVLVSIEPRDLCLEDRKKLVKATAGSWASDPSLDAILEEMARMRRTDLGRALTFDDPAR